MVTAYPYKVGKDPTYDAFKAKNDFTRQNAWYDAAAAQQKATASYNDALAALEKRGTTGRQNLATSLMSRGIFSSGEANRRRADLETALLEARSAADTTKAEQFGQISTDLQRAITGLDLDLEAATQEALARLGGRRRSTPSGTPPSPPAPTPTRTPQLPYLVRPTVGVAVRQ